MSHSNVREDQAPYQSAFDFPLTLRVNDSFEEFVRLNPDLVVEQNSNGEIVIMSPTGGEYSNIAGIFARPETNLEAVNVSNTRPVPTKLLPSCMLTAHEFEPVAVVIANLGREKVSVLINDFDNVLVLCHAAIA